MKKLLIFILLLSGCSKYTAERNIRLEFPNAEIYPIDGGPRYIVRDGTTVYLINEVGFVNNKDGTKIDKILVFK